MSFGSPLSIIYSPVQTDVFGSPLVVSGIENLAAAPIYLSVGISQIIIRQEGSLGVSPIFDIGIPIFEIE